MQSKYINYHKLYFGNEWNEQLAVNKDEFDYSEIDALVPFQEEHPQVMKNRIRKKNWKFDYDLSTNKLSVKQRIKLFLDQNLGINIGYKNYRIV